MAYMEWEPDGVSTFANSSPRRLLAFPPSPAKTLGYNHYGPLGHSLLDACVDHQTNPTNQLEWKMDAVVGRRTDMDADRQEAATHKVHQRVL